MEEVEKLVREVQKPDFWIVMAHELRELAEEMAEDIETYAGLIEAANNFEAWGVELLAERGEL